MTRLHVVRTGPIDPPTVVRVCIERGAEAVLLEADAVDESFTRLASGIAGDLLYRLGQYRLPRAGVVPSPELVPARFREFLGESNRGRDARWFTTREAAVAWLDSLQGTIEGVTP